MGDRDTAIKEAFSKVKEDLLESKKDTEELKQSYLDLQQKIATLDVKIREDELRFREAQLEQIAQIKEAITSALDEHLTRIKEITTLPETVSETPIPSQIPSQEVSQPETRLKAEYYRKIDKNRKKIIKTKIIETLKAKDLNLPELKTQIVDIEQFCSKATFYRYYTELKDLIQNPETATKEPIRLKKELFTNSVSE